MNAITFLKSSFVLLIFFFVNTNVQATNYPVLAFTGDNFRGSNIRLEDNWSVGNRFDYWNDAINSIKVPRGYEAHLFEHAHFRGEYIVIRGNWSSRDNRYWCNRISSIRIVPIGRRNGYRHDHHAHQLPVHTCGLACGDNCGYRPAPIITIFEHGGFRGASEQIQGEWSIYNYGDFWNDRISSIYVPRGYAVILYEHKHFQGNSIIIDGAWSVNSSHDYWNDQISSIRVVRQ